MAGSPSSYSSRSLGLDLLDFGYDSHVVDGLLPASPGGSPTTSGSGRSLLASSALSPDEPPDPDCAAGCPPADPHLSQADLVAPIDLVDFTSLGDDNGGNDDDNDGCASVASHRQDTPHPGGTGAADQLVVDDIDELLAELDLVSAHGGCMVGLGLSFGFGGTTDDDSFSLSEIDALLESLDKDAGAFPAVYPALVVRALGDVGRIVSAAMTPEQPVVDAAEPVVWPSPAALVARLGRCPLDMGPADSRNEQAQEGAIPDVLASLGGAYTPDYILYSVECADGGGSGCAPVGDAPRRFAEAVAHGRCYAQFHCKLSPESSASPAETTAGCLDVDEGTAQGPRSRASSIHSFDQPFENAQSIAKLMAALRVQPIVVSRPFVGPSRTVVLPRLC
ncbi:hypothetical protein H4R19_001807 [Coemansia spiralis]|nr:hypothetical protein H4R19_001807 [Coemansia spiralis]